MTYTGSGTWELVILDGEPPVAPYQGLGSMAVGDVDGDGHVELITGGQGALLWYRPDTGERGTIAKGHYGVGLALEDVDADGRLEVFSGRGDAPATLVWFDPGPDLHEPWAMHVVDANCAALAHDIIFADLDGDGTNELIANAAYAAWGVYGYKRADDPTAPWRKWVVQAGHSQEGLAAADLDGDGRVEIVSGPDWYAPPATGPLSGPWERRTHAVSFREMSRVALADVTGNGRPDVVIVESEYVDGKLSWMENRLLEDPEHPWREHLLEEGLVFAHTLEARQDAGSSEVRVFVAEMASGGWRQPYNYDARLLEFSTFDSGKTWERVVLCRGAGTHQALMADIDGDGVLEVAGKEWKYPKVHLFRRREAPSPLTRFRHRFLDRDKPYTATDILATDVDGDGLVDVVCGAWWYRNPDWTRREIPGIFQVVNAYDIDGDGREELVALKKSPGAERWYDGLSTELVWLKTVDALAGAWEEHPIGRGNGDWPHGTAIAPLLPGGRVALVAAYHGVNQDRPYYPEIFAAGDDPRKPWTKRVLTEVMYGEQVVPYDLDGDGALDLVVGPYWLRNDGRGEFTVYPIAVGFERSYVPITDSGGQPVESEDADLTISRACVADVNGNGLPDLVVGQQGLDFRHRVTPFTRLAWLENPGDAGADSWGVHVIDRVRCAHSLDVADLDGDGELEIVVGEHDPYAPYRSRCRLMVYKRADAQGRAWSRYAIDGRFEHHCGTKVIELEPGRLGIISHGWVDSRYVHLWEPEP